MTDQLPLFDLPTDPATQPTAQPTSLDIVTVIATAVATHPPGTPLDTNGNPLPETPED